ncbi:alpha-amylase family glycosyl hydrolase [Micromonosporaceae bacterium Da 78-11]
MTPVDEWWRGGVVYQVYPRSFADSDGDGVGDLAGLTARLDHIAGLGADAVWLTPFQRSPQADHGYDVSDYQDVDPLFGDLAAFDRMLARAHELGLRVVIDIVPNHCSAQHPLFQAALRGEDRDRFHFADEPNDWPSVFGGSAWTQVPDGRWYLHLYAPEQPDWNWRDPRTAPFFDDVVRFWFDRGVDGLRIDVAHGLYKKDGLPSLPPGVHPAPGRLRQNPFACDQPEVHDVYRGWRRIADSYDPPRALIGEVNLGVARAARYIGPDELHQAFAFEFINAPWSAAAWSSTGAELLGHPPVTWVVENHDVRRSSTRYGNDDRARAALLTVLGLPGAAYLYQGQELTLPTVDVPPDRRQDPAWTRSGRSRDGVRVPLPWQHDPAGAYGFSPAGAAGPWLPQPDGWGGHLDSPTLPLCRTALALRRTLHADGTLSPHDEVRWTVDHDDRLLARRGRFTLAVAMGATAVPLPPGEVRLASGPLTADGLLPPDTAAWVLDA